MLGLAGTPVPWADALELAHRYPWPVPTASREVTLTARTSGAPPRAEFWLDRVVAQLGRHPDERIDSYLEVLDSALLDRYLSAHEEDALIETAAELGLDRARLDEVHREYLQSLAALAWADRVVTRAELADLRAVGRLLGLHEQDVAEALDAARRATDRPVPTAFRLAAGDQVCLTGAMTHPRATVEALLAERGLTVGGLTRRTRLLVAADPDSQSGKAGKARGYGVPIVAEAALLGLLLAMEETTT